MSQQQVDQLTEVRTKISSLQQELTAVRAVPLPLSDAIARAKAMIANAKAAVPLPAAQFTHEDGPATINFRDMLAGEPSLLLIALAGDELGKLLEQRLKAVYSNIRTTITATDRAKRITSIEDEIFDAEIREETLLRQLERAGQEPDRRATARPEIVLATLED
jgi:hypothetical protein